MNGTEEKVRQQSLCLSCGICCDGTLFDYVPLKADDAFAPLVNFGIKINETDNEKSFDQPCAAYQKNCCQIYANRPASCQKYRCLLLTKYENGEVSREDAEQQIHRVRQIQKSLETELMRVIPQHENLSLRQMKQLMPENEKMRADPILLKKWATAALSLSMLLDHLKRHFRLPEKKNELPIK